MTDILHEVDSYSRASDKNATLRYRLSYRKFDCYMKRDTLKTFSLLSALPYFVLWILSFFFSPLADFLIVRHYLSIGNVRKIFNSIGRDNCIVVLIQKHSPCCFRSDGTSHNFGGSSFRGLLSEGPCSCTSGHHCWIQRGSLQWI
jgi:hypothetical protein